MTGEDNTSNGIHFDSWTAGPEGAGFELHPIKHVHTAEQVRQAKAEIRWEHDVVSLSVKWQTDPIDAIVDRWGL